MANLFDDDKLFAHKSTAVRHLRQYTDFKNLKREKLLNFIDGDNAPFSINIIKVKQTLQENITILNENSNHNLKIDCDNVRNGIKRPKKNGVCFKIWQVCDEYLAKNGKNPTSCEIVALCSKFSKITVYRQVNEWRQYYGFKLKK